MNDHLLFFHGCSLYRQLEHVPLVIVDNEGLPSKRVVAEPVSLCDRPARVVGLLGLGRDAPNAAVILERFRNTLGLLKKGVSRRTDQRAA
jgi:hypothetical protein